MSHQVITNSKCYLDGYDLSGDMSALALQYGAELKDSTTLGSASRKRATGLYDVSASHEGFWDGGDTGIDAILYGKIGVVNVPMTVVPLTGAEGDKAYTFLADLGSYSPGGPVGEMFGFSVSAEGAGPLVRGTLIHNAAKTATGTGTAFQVGQVGATQKLYASLHVLSASAADTLDVVIQSDTVGFGSATNRITFSQASAIGSQWATPVSGAITDDYWRVSYTIGGVGPSFTFAVTIGIL